MSRRLVLLVVVPLFCGWLPGCAVGDGGYVYDCRGRLVGPDGRSPLAGVPVAVAQPRTDEEWLDRTAGQTDVDGRFTARYTTGLAWGETIVLGIIRLGGPEDPPPPVSRVWLKVRHNGQWRSMEVRPVPGTQPAELDLGDVTVPAEAGNGP